MYTNPEIYTPERSLEKIRPSFKRIANQAVELTRIKFGRNKYLSKRFDEGIVRQTAEEIILENDRVWSKMLDDFKGDAEVPEKRRAEALADMIMERLEN